MASQPDAGVVLDGQPGDRLPAPGAMPGYDDVFTAINEGVLSNETVPQIAARVCRLPGAAPPAAADPDLGRVAYEAEGAWLDEFAPGSSAPWDTADPEVRELYQRMAGSVARAVRGRAEAAEAKLAAIVAYCQAQADDFNATMPMRVRPQDIRVGARGILAITGTEGTQERDEKGPGHG